MPGRKRCLRTHHIAGWAKLPVKVLAALSPPLRAVGQGRPKDTDFSVSAWRLCFKRAGSSQKEETQRCYKGLKKKKLLAHLTWTKEAWEQFWFVMLNISFNPEIFTKSPPHKWAGATHEESLPETMSRLFCLHWGWNKGNGLRGRRVSK